MRGQTVAWRWLRRVRGWWPDRNPLRRRCDRAEAALFTVLVAVFLAGAPLLALSAGRWAHDSGPPAGHAQRARWHQVPVVLAPVGGLGPHPPVGGRRRPRRAAAGTGLARPASRALGWRLLRRPPPARRAGASS